MPLTTQQRQIRQNVRNAYFCENRESILQGIKMYESADFDHTFEIACLEELLAEI